MQVSLTSDEVRRYVRQGVYDDLRMFGGSVVLHKNGGATVELQEEPEGADTSDEEA